MSFHLIFTTKYQETAVLLSLSCWLCVCFVLISKSQHANVVGQDDAHDTLNQVKKQHLSILSVTALYSEI